MPEGAKSAEGIFTIGENQHILEGKEIVLQTSQIDNSKAFESYTWKENGKVLGTGARLSISSLPLGLHHILCEMKDKEGNVYVDIVSITIKESNQRPVADDFTLTLNEDSSISTYLKGGDADGDELHYLFSTRPVHGVLSGSTAHLTYTPIGNYYGEDSFQFKTNDGTIDSRIATVSIVVKPVNDAPIVKDDYADVRRTTEITIDVLENNSDSDIDNDKTDLYVSSVATPLHGTAIISADKKSIIYTASTDASDFSFTYTTSDGKDESSATVHINIIEPFVLTYDTNNSKTIKVPVKRAGTSFDIDWVMVQLLAILTIQISQYIPIKTAILHIK